MASNPNISAIILAGGRGQRMGNRDKGLINWKGQTLISRVIDKIAPQVDDITINCNQHISDYQKFGFETVKDTLDEFQGPLAGIQASLAVVKHSYCLICPCDTPNLPTNLVENLLNAVLENNADLAYPVCALQNHYIPVLMKRTLNTSLDNYLANGGRSIHGWYKNLKTEIIDFSGDENAFLNVNSLDMLDYS